MKFKTLALAVAALASVSAATVASAGARRDAILYNKEVKQSAKEDKRTSREQYKNGEITREEKNQIRDNSNAEIQDAEDNIDELKASK